ncbi:DUF885 domain-containing protein [Pseudoxanthomonas wuyuanensis]|uniref:Uncharacterized conserved protein, DUF885 familyt n=1 Tax=Pseudoxanthomonas wuyuanensis TaxID=1073196 RepID=A0A286CWT2_9GAMM|nr:DUF885 domain-containing protein [Pseudoxanthomonas wuyuanensis]KAF1720893.1 DUF885 domain-containing protein [Pseudoxanthomonas wuyuanensis]SOD50862.1 Uncharacterized conserved protein, DUF885 familyt [Pseudoxanthomonas wuyuanensis]
MPTKISLLVLGAVCLLAGAGAVAAVPEPAATAPSFNAMIDAQTMRAINANPELRTMLGIGGTGDDTSDRLTDVSLARRDGIRADLADSLKRIQAWDRNGLDAQERLTYDLATWFYNSQIELMAHAWAPAWMPMGDSTYAVDQLFSAPVNLPQFMDNHHAVGDEASARNYIARLRAMGDRLDQVRENFEMQVGQGAVPPEVALQGAASQFRALLQPVPQDSVWVRSLQRKLDKLPAIAPQRRAELLAEAAAAVQERTNPGYARLLASVDEVLARKPGNHGVWAAPQGAAYYDAALRWYTSTGLDADAIHRIGVEEVARLEQAMDARLRQIGLGNGAVADRMGQLRDDPRYRYADSAEGRQQLIEDMERRLADLEPILPGYFGRLPPQKLEVKPVPEHAQATSPGGYYYPPALDGSRPGTFFINLGDIETNTRWSTPTLVYHEGAPGHHFQISIGQTLSDLPLLRRSLNPSAFTEGWALYAEQLVAEAGVYRDDPAGDIGRLQAEMFRAVRLVVDTGLHRKRWTPEQAIDYMRGKTGMKESDVRLEVHRYLVQPGQACSYKIGHLKLVELRERARTQLGDRFDIGAFHDLILGNGALPLLLVEQVVDEWIAAGGVAVASK